MIIDEEEQLVLEDGTAHGAAELIPTDGPRNAAPVVAPVVGIELVIAKILESVAMELIGSGLDHYVDDPSLEVAKFGRGVVRDQLELCNRVRVRLIRNQVVRGEVVVDAVQQEVIRFLTIAVHVRPPAARGALAAIEAARIGVVTPAVEQRQGDRIAADQRCMINLAGGDYRADLRCIRLQRRRLSRNRHRLRDYAYLHRDVYRRARCQFQRVTCDCVRLEALDSILTV